jgi:ABC-2 type transport system permease protein
VKPFLLVKKDLLVLRRSPLLLALLVAYPLLMAALVGLVAVYGSSKPHVALVDQDGLPSRVEIGGEAFNIDRTIRRVSKDVTLVHLDEEEARRQLETGKVVAVLTVPTGFISQLRGMVESPKLELHTARGGISSRVTQQVQALVYSLNRELQTAFIQSNLRYIDLIREGGSGEFLGREFDLLGLQRSQEILENEFPPSERLAEIRDFIGVAGLALDQTDEALRATANPIELERTEERGRSAVLSAQVQAYGLALTITFVALVLAAGALASEREENVLGRLVRGPVTRSGIVAAKVLLAVTVATALGLGLALAFGLIVELGGVEGGEPWGRLPLLAAGLALAGAAVGAVGALLGALAGEARTASLAAVLIVLPIVFVGLIPRQVVPLAGWVSDGLPFVHAMRFFSSALFDLSPWATLARETVWLIALGAIFAGFARLGMRRLTA